MRIRLFLLVAAVALLLVALGPATLLTAPVSAAGPQLVAIPFHPVNPNYWQIKAAIDAKAPRGGATNVPTAGPTVFVNANGQPHDIYSPADSNGAIGPTEYIETVNESIGVFDRNLNKLSSNGLTTWGGNTCNTGDPVMMYSAADQRYYFTCISSPFSGNYILGFGWSKTSAPSANGSDWCFYTNNFGGRYGTNLPDYPKLGDTSQMLMIGVNVFQNASFYIGSDVALVQKPPKGNLTSCTFSPKVGTFQNLKNKDGSLAATPNPMKQADAAPFGAVVANEDAQTSTHLTLYKVSLSGTTPKISAPIDEVVPAYSYPPSAPQKGTTRTLDTLDSRLMSGWFYKDPNQGNNYCAITGHTVAASSGGLGAEFRWYEFCAPTGAMVASGKVQSTSRYVFMGAIAPDRNGATGQFGTKWLATVNTSSSTIYVTVSAASAGGMTDIFSSTAPDTDFTCNPVCRWGDYSGASPDPAATSVGQVWGTAMFSMSGSPGWGTWNFGAQP
jgi:hypothetical protein